MLLSIYNKYNLFYIKYYNQQIEKVVAPNIRQKVQ